MAQLDIQETFRKLAVLLESYGVQAHSEDQEEKDNGSRRITELRVMQ